jgi:hypothetical protein
MKRVITLLALGVSTVGATAVFAPDASAHEARTVTGYTGWWGSATSPPTPASRTSWSSS